MEPKRYPQALKDATPGALRAAVMEFAGELYRGRVEADRHVGRTIDGPKQAWRAVRDIANNEQEHLIGLYVDSQNRVTQRKVLSVGSLNATRTHPREILFPAVSHLALGFILAHNHPSGNLKPSEADINITKKVNDAANLLDIKLLDHLILSPEEQYYSFADEGDL